MNNFKEQIGRIVPLDEYTDAPQEIFDFNKLVGLLSDCISAQHAYPDIKSIPIITEALKGLMLKYTSDDLLKESSTLAAVKRYIFEIARKDTVRRRYIPAASPKLSIIAKRRYWRHKNKYKLALQGWKEANKTKPFYDRMQKYARQSFSEQTVVYREDIMGLMKAVSSAYTHFLIGVEHDPSLTEIVAPISEMISASIDDLSKIMEQGEGPGIVETYQNTLFVNSMLFTNLNLDLIVEENESSR